MGLIGIALATLSYSSINRGINKKEGVILGYLNIYNILIFVI